MAKYTCNVILFNCSARKQQHSYFSANFQDSLGKPAPECQTTLHVKPLYILLQQETMEMVAVTPRLLRRPKLPSNRRHTHFYGLVAFLLSNQLILL